MAEEIKEQPRTGGNTRLPFGLCKRYGIDLPDDATPRDAWNALKEKGITREKVYSALKKSGSTKGLKAEKDSASEKKNANPYEGADAQKMQANNEKSFTDKTKYKKQHDEIVDFVKEQVGVDLNKYRSGDGSSPFTTTYWEKGDALTIDKKAISHEDMNRLNNLFSKGKLKKEDGGGWFWHISFVDNKTKK